MIKVYWLAALRVGGTALVIFKCNWCIYNLKISPANGKKSFCIYQNKYINCPVTFPYSDKKLFILGWDHCDTNDEAFYYIQ